MADKIAIASAVSDAEVEVLQQLWVEAPLSAQGIIDRMAGKTSAQPRTIKTLINRLLNKGALGFREQERKYLYYPLIGKEDFYRIKTESFLHKFFDGELAPLVCFFSGQKRLSDKQIEELRELVDKLEADEEN